jgi:hypothetical protein
MAWSGRAEVTSAATRLAAKGLAVSFMGLWFWLVFGVAEVRESGWGLLGGTFPIRSGWFRLRCRIFFFVGDGDFTDVAVIIIVGEMRLDGDFPDPEMGFMVVVFMFNLIPPRESGLLAHRFGKARRAILRG